MNELETRILDIDIDFIRAKMKEINAKKVKSENQINNIFDFPSRSLLSKKGYARVRIVENLIDGTSTSFITTKKMISQDKFKVMEENETTVGDSAEAIDIFKALGLELVESIKKYRESYKYKNSLIEIDVNDKSFCPFPYIEIETSSEEELKEIVKLLGYSMNDTTSETIYEILKRRGLR